MITTAEDAVREIRSFQKVFIHGVAAAPQALIKALTARADELEGVEIYHLHTEGPAPYADPKYRKSFRINSLFVGDNVRQAVQNGRGSYIPVFLSEIPTLFRKQIIPIDVALISVSPPDKHGFCSLGVAVDATKAAVESAKMVIAQANRKMPRTHGDGLIHYNNIDLIITKDEELPEIKSRPVTDIAKQIGRHITELIEDGSTLQMGIGMIPDAVLESLHSHKDLGIHTEMFSDGIMPLVKKGVITGKYKTTNPGKIVSSFVVGTRKLYNFIDDNPLINLMDSSYVNNSHVIASNPKMIAINSAIEVDLTGQVCADSIGEKIYSGVGGQMDFIRGASLSQGGKPIIALPSTTKDGQSRIVRFLKQGAGVVTTRAHVHYVITEWGAANLYGKTLEARAKELIAIAHPDHRENLEKQVKH